MKQKKTCRYFAILNDVMTHPGRASRAPEWERTESVIEDILRWADDGGKMPDPGRRAAEQPGQTRMRLRNGRTNES